VGADLHEGAIAVGEQALAGLLEAHRLSEVAVPVGGGELGGLKRLGGDRGVEGGHGLAGLDLGQDLEHLLFELLDVVAVGGDRRRHLAGADALPLAVGEEDR
jgi:hypothetical protein